MSAPEFPEFVVSAVLEGAFELLSTSEDWASNAQARTSSGRPTLPEANEATSWCAFGALRAAFMALRPEDGGERGRALLLADAAALRVSLALAREFRVPCSTRDARRYLIEWNDVPGRRWQDVVLLYEKTLGLRREPALAA